jgi:hypothetical protein
VYGRRVNGLFGFPDFFVFAGGSRFRRGGLARAALAGHVADGFVVDGKSTAKKL